jgi:hypothetical protein
MLLLFYKQEKDKMDRQIIVINNMSEYAKMYTILEDVLFKNAMNRRVDEFVQNNKIELIQPYLESCLAEYHLAYNLEEKVYSQLIFNHIRDMKINCVKQLVINEWLDEHMYVENVINNVASHFFTR